MNRLKKHIGIIKSTSTRVLVVFREMPDDSTRCLIAEFDRMPDKYRDRIQEILNSNEAMQTNDLYEVLAKKAMVEHQSALNGLHINGLLRTELVENIVMTPLPNQELPLSILNDQIRSAKEVSNNIKETVVDPTQDMKKNIETGSDEARMEAESLIVQARLLREDADIKEARARELAPELFTPKMGRPTLSTSQKAEAIAKEKSNRKKRDAKKAEAIKTAEINKKVQEKIERDLVAEKPSKLD